MNSCFVGGPIPIDRGVHMDLFGSIWLQIDLKIGIRHGGVSLTIMNDF